MKSEKESAFLQSGRAIRSPISLKENIIASPSHFIQSYNPHNVLPTANKGLAATLDETYKLKDNVTEESVMTYFNDVIAGFDEKTNAEGGAALITSKQKDSKVENSNANNKILESNKKSKDDEFYFNKSSWPLKNPSNKNTQEGAGLDRREFQASKSRVYSLNEKPRYDSNNNKTARKVNSLNNNTSNSRNSSHSKKDSSPPKRNEYQIELFTTNKSAANGERLIRTDSVMAKPITTKQMVRSNQDDTVKGFDSFMMY